MFKLENQLPLWVLEEIMVSLGWPIEGNWFEPVLKNLSPVEVKQRSRSPTYSKKIHILQLLGEYMVDNRAGQSISTSSQYDETEHNREDEESGSHDSKAIQEDGNHHNQEDVQSDPYDNLIINGLLIMFYVFLFLILLPVIILWLLWLVICFMWGKAEKNERHVPTVGELDKIGVNLKALKSKGISRIEFKSKSSTLYLPKFTVDDRSEVIVRNLLVMETHWEDTEKVITRYVVFMNDLISTSLDVARLRTEGIIVNKLGSDDDVARMWNSVTIPATGIPKYDQIDTACTKINAYRRKWWRVLWSQF
ncbi:hypothetical protein SUGI_0363180 [Cryptomeria japonica]|nr:hypothetical protein SUGI_0363180 [Cryptomeria japonica]